MVASCQLNNADNDWSYCPSQPAASVFVVLFGITTALHIVQAFLYRKSFCWVIILGGAGETAAFVCRSLSMSMPWQHNNSLYEAQFILILVTPLLMNAFDYMILGRMVNFLIPDRTLLGIPARRIVLYLIILDIISFLIQIFGAVLTGLALQQASILCFVYLAVSFNKKLNIVAVNKNLVRDGKKLMIFVYASLVLISFCIVFRIVFRITEFSGGHVTDVIKDNEWFTYVFDFGPMFLALILFNIRHPGTFLQGPGSEFERQTWKERLTRRRQRTIIGSSETGELEDGIIALVPKATDIEQH